MLVYLGDKTLLVTQEGPIAVMIDTMAKEEAAQAKPYIHVMRADNEELNQELSRVWLSELQAIAHKHFSSQQEKWERVAILQSPFALSFYVSFLLAARSMTLACESLLVGSVEPALDDRRHRYNVSVVQRGVFDTVSDVASQDVVKGLIQIAASDNQVPSAVATLFSLLALCQDEEEKQEALARVARFVAVAQVTERSGGIKLVLERVARNLVRIRSLDGGRFDVQRKRWSDQMRRRAFHEPPMSSYLHRNNDDDGVVCGRLAATELLFRIMDPRGALGDVTESKGMPQQALELHVPCLSTLLEKSAVEIRSLPLYSSAENHNEIDNDRHVVAVVASRPLDVAARHHRQVPRNMDDGDDGSRHSHGRKKKRIEKTLPPSSQGNDDDGLNSLLMGLANRRANFHRQKQESSSVSSHRTSLLQRPNTTMRARQPDD